MSDGGATLPSGVTFTDTGYNLATLSGTPAAGTAGTYPFTITAANGGTSISTLYFTLTVVQACQITSSADATFTAGQAGTFIVSSTGTPTCALSETGALPSGVTFTNNGNGTATLVGTPAPGSSGTYPFTITATNVATPAATQAFTLTVNHACTITSPGPATFTVGQAGTPVTITSTGTPTCALSETGTLPSGVTFTDNGDGTATLVGTPGPDTGGTYTFTITATNGVSPDATQSFTFTVTQAPAITSPAGTTFTAGQAGTFTVKSTGVPNAALSETGALPAGVTFTDNGNGTATLAGTPAAGSAGPYPFTINATNGVIPDATQAFTLTVNHACTITSRRAATFTVGQAGTPVTITSTGTPTCALSETGTLPTGVTFTDNGDGTATLAGTPTTGGTYKFTINATNGVSPDATQSFTLTVNAAACQITSSKGTAFTVGQAGTYTVTTTGYPLCQLSEKGALPPGVSFIDNRDGTATLAGTPAPGSSGTYPVTITGTNGVNPAATQSFTLTINQAPGITSPAGTTFTVGQAGTFTVTSTGVPNAALSETGKLPTGVTFTDNGNGTATLAGTPAPGSSGTYPFTITATNGASPDATQSFTLTINQPCQITSPAAGTFTTGQAGTPVTVTSTGSPTCALTATGLPSGVGFKDNGDGTATLAGTPAPGTGGTYLLTITATNGAGSDTQTFTLTVLQAPGITSPGHATCTVGMACAFTVRSSGVPTPGLSESGKLPSGVLFTDNGDGTAALSGIPAAGSAGTYPFTITATNGVGSAATQSFTLTVNQAPGITSSAGTTFTVGQAGTFSVTSTGVPNAALSETGKLPSGVTFTDNGDGTATLAGTPAAGTGGTYPFTITATNGVGSAATQSFTLTVNQAPGITSSAGTTFTVGQAGTFSVTSTGVPTPGLSEKGALPRGVKFKDNGDGTATLSGTPTTGGVYTFRIAAKNGVSPDATQSFTLTVVGLPAAPSGLKATGRGKTVSLTWNNNASTPSATAILIQRSTNAGFTTGIVNTTVGPNVTTHIDTAVVKGKRYYYRVRTHNTVGNSAWSNVSNVTAP